MAKTKYSEEIAKIICDAIATQGGDESGWTAGAIDKATFYRWMRDFCDFCNSVVRARAEFRKNAPISQKRSASQKLTDALENGHTIQWEAYEKGTIIRYKGDGTVWYTEERDLKTGHTERRPTPQWAIDRVIPKPVWTLDQLNAVAAEIGCVVVVKDAELFNRYLSEVASQSSKTDTRTGLSDEGVHQIRARILGVEEDAPGTSSVPREVG